MLLVDKLLEGPGFGCISPASRIRDISHVIIKATANIFSIKMLNFLFCIHFVSTIKLLCKFGVHILSIVCCES